MPAATLLLVLSLATAPQLPCEIVRLEDPSATDSHFGHAVTLHGDRMVVGVPSPPPGRAHVFERGVSGWTHATTLAPADLTTSAMFGWAVALQGDFAAVTRRGDGELNSKGSVYIFKRRPSGQWIQTQKLVPPPISWAFGWSLAMEGDRLAVGAKGASELGNKGRIYVYGRQGDHFVLEATIAPSLDHLGDWFGASVALHGDRIAVGAPKTNTGRAYVFDRQSDGTWVEQALFVPVDGKSADEFGYSVAVHGDTVAVGAFGHDLPFLNIGAVYVYQRDASGWSQATKLTPTVFTDLPRYGYSLALTADELFVGAPTWTNADLSRGRAVLYRRSESAWTYVGHLQPTGPIMAEWFGASMGRDGGDIAIAAPAATSPTRGRVHLYSHGAGAHLDGAAPAVSLGSGGVQPFQLGACAEHGGDFYVLLGSVSGNAPALPLGNASLPLVVDGYFALTLEQPNNPLLPNSLGVLDEWGRAYASFELPAGIAPGAAGLTLHHAYLVLDSATLEVRLASNAVPVLLKP